MAGAKVGAAFVKHEFEGAIAIQEAIVDAETALARTHPVPEARAFLATCLRDDRASLADLRRFGRARGATGEVEDMAADVIESLRSSVDQAPDADSDAYEAHALLLNAKRRQQDAVASIAAIARALQDTELRDAAHAFAKAQQQCSQELAELLARFAVRIATRPEVTTRPDAESTADGQATPASAPTSSR